MPTLRTMRPVSLFCLFWSILCSVGAYRAAYASDPSWSVAIGPEMNTARMGHGNAVLPDGRVVLFGGHGTGFTSLGSAEVWTPSTNAFRPLTMRYRHDFGAISTLHDGRYLLAGGAADLGVAPGYNAAEIYDPLDDSFTSTGTLARARMNCSGARLSNGKVLIAGGWYDNASASYGELYNPSTGSFGSTGALHAARALPVVLPTNDAKAVVFGGLGPFGSPMIEQVELYDSASNSFTVLRNTLFDGEAGWNITATNYTLPQQLADGKYLLLAYKSKGSAYEYTLFTFDPATKAFARKLTLPALPDSSTAGLSPPIVDLTAQKAFVIGSATAGSSVQLRLYVIDLNAWTLSSPSVSYVLPPSYYPGYMAAALLQDGRLFLTGGHSKTGSDTNFSPLKKTLLASIVTADCSYAISPVQQSFGASGGTGTVTVTTSSSSCAWTAESHDDWLSITSGGSGAGGGTVRYSVEANPSSTAETGTLTIAGKTFTVTQAGKPETTFPPSISVSPSSINMGSVKVGSASSPKGLTIRNSGKGELVLRSIEFSGASAAEFREVGECSTVVPGGSCSLSITLTAGSAGKKDALLTIASNDPKKPELTIKVSGQAMPPVIAVNPSSVNLGSVKVGSPSMPKALTIRNTGTSDLLIHSIELSGGNAAEFSEAGNCSTVAAGGSCTLDVALTAASPGKKAAVLTLSSNDPKKPALAVKLSGQAMPPVISVSPSSVAISSLKASTLPYTKTVTVKNTGLSDLLINSVTISGTNPSEFRQTNHCTTIAQGGSCPVTVEFMPTSTTKKTAVLTISSNDPKKPSVAVKLSGSAVPRATSNVTETNEALKSISSAISSGSAEQVLSRLDKSTRLQISDLDLSSPQAQQVATALSTAEVTEELQDMVFYKSTLGSNDITFYMIREEGTWRLCGF